MSLVEKIDVSNDSSAIYQPGQQTGAESSSDAGPIGTLPPLPELTVIEGAISVTQTTDYVNDDLVNVPDITFDTTANSIATFTADQFAPQVPGHIDNNVGVHGDSHADTVSVVVTDAPDQFGGYGFDGSQIQLDNWSASDKFVITVEENVPTSAYVELNGTSGNDTFQMGETLNTNDEINGEDGTNSLKLAGDYSGGLGINGTYVHNIERIDLGAGFSYALGIGGGVTPTGSLTVDGQPLTANNTMLLDVSEDSFDQFVIWGGAGTNNIYLNGQADIVHAGSGTNNIYGGDGELSTGTKIEGAGTTELWLAADYSAGYTFAANQLSNVGEISLSAGYSYKLTINNADVAEVGTLTVDASALGTGDSLYFNGTHVTGGTLDIIGGAGLNTLYGGSENDVFEFDGAGQFTAVDRINGEDGSDNVLFLNGSYASGLAFANSTITNIQDIELSAGSSYKLTLANGNVAAGATLSVDGSSLSATDTLDLKGSKVLTGNLALYGGAGNDTLIGGGGSNTFTGGGGADTMTAGTGANAFVYNGVSDSTSTTHDNIIGFNFATDNFKFQFSLVNPNAIDPAVTTGTLGSTNFDAQLAADIGANQLHAGDAVLFTPNAGGYAGHTFLIVDENGVAGYQAGHDLVIELTNATNLAAFSTANFLT